MSEVIAALQARSVQQGVNGSTLKATMALATLPGVYTSYDRQSSHLGTRSAAAVDGAELAVGAQRPQGLREGHVSWGKQLDSGLGLLLSASGLHARGEDHFLDFGATGISGVARGLDGERDKEIFGRLTYGPWAVELVHGDRRKDDPTGV